MVLNLKYFLGHIFYIGLGLFIFFFGMLFFMIFFASFASIISFIIPQWILILLGSSFLIVPVLLFAVAFCISCFFPVSLLLSGTRKNSLIESMELGLKHFRPVSMLLFLEGFVKITSYLLIVVVIYGLGEIDIDLASKDVFDNLPKLTEFSAGQEGIYYTIHMISWGVFHILWDIFKSIFLSAIYVNRNFELSAANAE